MPTRFESLKLGHSGLFGVRVSGTVGRVDKDRLRELADKCLERGKVRLVMDLSGLNAIGGGGAKVLAEFQQRLVAAEGEAVFCGAGQVVRHFLEQKFDDLPLRIFATLGEAVDICGPEAEAASASAPQPVAGDVEDADGAGHTVGTVAFSDDDPYDPALEGVLENLADDHVGSGRRKDHHYTSLSEAVASLGRWTDHDDHAVFARALGNLLFSHGLAEETVLLTRRGDLMVDASGDHRLPASCGFVRAVAASNRPLTLLDLDQDQLGERDADLLEEVDPDIILPVVMDDDLAAIVLLRREGTKREYSVAEHFALELLMRVMTAKDEAEIAPSTAYEPEDENFAPQDPTWVPDGTSPAEVLLQLALDLPEAVDRPHFWRIFARHCWPVLPVTQLGFLAPERTRPQIMVGTNDSWMALDFGPEKLQLFFTTIERPVAVDNMPHFFKASRLEMRAANIDWIVSLKWDGKYLGTVFLTLNPDFIAEDTTALLEEIFNETSRLLYRYDGSNDNADVNLELVRILVSLREKLCFGSDVNTTAMVAHVNRLARVMAFPPDQERDLLYGCLLRDIGLFDKSDGLTPSGLGTGAHQHDQLRRHPDEGAALVAGLNLPQSIIDVVRFHHERFDGKGFPRGLKGRDIPLAARVVAVVEYYTALVTGTSGDDAMRPEDAAAALREKSGADFDPELVEVFLRAVLPKAFRRRLGPLQRMPQNVR